LLMHLPGQSDRTLHLFDQEAQPGKFQP